MWLRQEAAARDLCNDAPVRACRPPCRPPPHSLRWRLLGAAFGDRGANPNRAPHGATMLGALCALLGLPPQVAARETGRVSPGRRALTGEGRLQVAAEVIAYTTARDVLSAAVRETLSPRSEPACPAFRPSPSPARFPDA